MEREFRRLADDLKSVKRDLRKVKRQLEREERLDNLIAEMKRSAREMLLMSREL